ncbi:MAG TPA: cytidylate kinase-like family protein [Chloroflexia bacterium]|nr:cytidylate kinase-like family protein [Chloroflexia bacterium]
MAENEEPKEPSIEQMRAVTISREYGSGGGEIGAQLARRLGWKLIDHEVVVQMANVLGISEVDAEAYDEHVDNAILRILTNLGENLAPVSVPTQTPVQRIGPQDYKEARRKVVEAAVASGHAIIIGRGAQVLLAGRRDVLHVRIIAPLEQRIAYVMRREGLDHTKAQERIQSKDRDRARFLATVHQRNPQDEHLYDVVVNTAVIELSDVVELVVLALEKKARKLNTPESELGPGTGLRQYGSTPGNFNLTGEPEKI